MERFPFDLQRFDDENISNIDDNVSVAAGNGNDSINNFGNNVTIIGGAGDNYLDNDNGINGAGNHGMIYIYGGGNDTINRFRNDDNFLIIEGYYDWEAIGNDDTGNVLVNVLNGTDNGTETVGSITIPEYWANKINILTSKEEFAALNLISNDKDNQTLMGTNAKDVITNSGKNVSIVGNANNDSIYNYDESGINNDATGKSSKSTIYGGAGDDYIANRASNVTVFGGEGNDYVKFDTWLYAADMVYVYGGGNDTLDRFNHRASIVLGDVKINSTLDTGEALVLRLNNGKTLTLTNGGYNTNIVSSLDEVPKINVTHNDKSNVVVTGKQEDGAIDFIFNDYDSNNVTINGSDNNDMIGNDGDKVLINAGAGDDIIDNDEANATINAGAGNDTIVSFWDNVSIDGSAGNDSINNNSANSSVNGGAGNDYIYNTGESYNTTIDGGEGDDTIEAWGNEFVRYSGGNDSITAFGDDDTLQIISGTVDEVKHEGDKNFLTIGENVVTVEGTLVNVIDQDGNSIDIGGDTDADADTDTDADADADSDTNFIENYDSNVIIDGTDGNDIIYNDTKTDNVTINALGGNDSIQNNGWEVSIDLGAGHDTIDNNASIVKISGGDGSDTIHNWGDLVTIDGGAGNEYIFNFAEGSNVIINGDDGNDEIGNDGENVTISGGAGRDTIYNTGSNVSIDGGASNDYISNSGENVTFIYSDGSDTLKGIDAENIDLGNVSILSSVNSDRGVILNLSNGNFILLADADSSIETENALGWKVNGSSAVYSSGDEILVELDGIDGREKDFAEPENNTVKLSDLNFSEDGVTVISNAGGYAFEIAEDSYSSGTFFKGSAGKDSITNNGNYLNIDAGAGKDSIVNNAENVTIAGGDGNDKIINYSTNVEISGGKGNDNVTVSGGEVGNIFSYAKGDGNDILFDFTETDSIKIADDSAVEANIDGNDIVFKVGSGSITIHDGANGREVLFVGADGKTEIDSLSGNEYTSEGIITYDDGGEAGIVLTSTFRD